MKVLSIAALVLTLTTPAFAQRLYSQPEALTCKVRPVVQFDPFGATPSIDDPQTILVAMAFYNRDTCDYPFEDFMIEGHMSSGGPDACRYDNGGFFDPVQIAPGDVHRRFWWVHLTDESPRPCLLWATGQIWRTRAFPNGVPDFSLGTNADLDVVPVFIK